MNRQEVLGKSYALYEYDPGSWTSDRGWDELLSFKTLEEAKIYLDWLKKKHRYKRYMIVSRNQEKIL